MSYGVICTGSETEWQAHIFSNGSVLDIYRTHSIYSTKTGGLVHSTGWKAGNGALGLDGEECHFVAQKTYKENVITDRFLLFTENNLYFANGILCGCYPDTKFKYANCGLLRGVTDEDMEDFKELAKIFDDNKYTWRNKEYIKEAAPIMEMTERCKNHMERLKNKLSKLDYKTVKRSQGAISDEDWECTCSECAHHRSNIAIMEEKHALYKQSLDELKKKHGIKKKTMTELFLEGYAIGMRKTRERAARLAEANKESTDA
jgi:hypothetical protein